MDYYVAQEEYELIGITLNLTFTGMLYNTNQQTFDGKNTVSVSPDVTSGETHFYSTQLYKRMEFDMKLSSLAYIIPETLYLSLLHEFGHVYGLDHPDKPDDSVMGKPMIHKPDDSYIQEYKYHTLTQNDVIALYKHESLFRSTSAFQRMHLNLLLLNVILPKYPRGLDDCTSIPRLTLNPTQPTGIKELREFLDHKIFLNNSKSLWPLLYYLV